MRYFIVRLTVNALAVALTIVIAPGIHLQSDLQGPLVIPVILALLGVLFGLINAFIRPVVLLVTGKILIWSMGLFTLIINGLLFYLLSWLAPNTFIIDDPALFWVVVAGVVMSVVVTVLEAIFGLDSPVIDEHKESKFYWRWFSRLPAGRRSVIVQNLRLMQVYDTIHRFGVDILVDLTPLAGLRQAMQRIIYPNKRVVIEEEAPETVRLMLQELGPTYVKLGQMVASRSEILPAEWEGELSKLQSDVAPFPYNEVQRIVQQELGEGPEKCFANFDRQPIAAASMAQVHRATLHSGEHVVVKVQRPDIDVTVRGDLKVMQNVVTTLEKRMSWARSLGLSGMVDEFTESVIEELDYENEAYYARRLKHSMNELDFVYIPKVYGEYSTSKVITLEYVVGVKITDLPAVEAAGIEREQLARSFIRAMNKQVLLDGFFHGDPHPGNVWVDLATSRIIFLDLGMMGQMNDESRLALFDIIWSLKNGESRNLTNILLRLSTQTRAVDNEQLARDVDRLVQRYVVYSDKPPELSVIVQSSFNLLYNYGLMLDRSLTIALKGLMQAEELVRTLAPEISFIHTAVDEVQSVMMDQVRGDVVYEQVKQQGLRTAKDIFVHMPAVKRSAAKWIKQFEEGRITLHIDTQDLTEKLDSVDRHLDQSVRQLVLGMLLVGMLLGSAIVSTISFKDSLILNFIPQELFSVVLLFVILISVVYIVVILWSTWQKRKR